MVSLHSELQDHIPLQWPEGNPLHVLSNAKERESTLEREERREREAGEPETEVRVHLVAY